MGKKAKALEKELAAASEAAKKSAWALRLARNSVRCLEFHARDLETKIAEKCNTIRNLREAIAEVRTEQRNYLWKLETAAKDCHLHLLTMTKNTDGAVRNYLGDACNILGRVLGKDPCPYGWKPEDEAYTRAEVLRIVR